jgi:glycosyltransferase involved in cell wall biosynthesis
MLWRWRDLPLLAAKHQNPALSRAIARARAEFAPDVALVEMAQMAQFLPLLRGLPTVLTDHEAGVPGNAATGLGAAADRRDARLWQRYVARYYPLADHLQAVTEEDASQLRAALGREVTVRPAALPRATSICDAGAAPEVALFLGNYLHHPNVEAAHRLVDEVWPRVRALRPDARLRLAGPHHGPIAALADRPGVEVAGFVEDLAALLGGARLLLSPLWSGGGFRVKSATALLHGLPVVTNPLGARGCRAPEPACAVCDDDQALAEAAARLLGDAAQAREAGGAAQLWAASTFDADHVARSQLARIEALLQRAR